LRDARQRVAEVEAQAAAAGRAADYRAKESIEVRSWSAALCVWGGGERGGGACTRGWVGVGGYLGMG
jgi:hypothetical protein